MGYYSKKEVIIEVFLQTLTKPKNLPYKIITNKYPNRKKNCRLHHGEIVITSWDKKTKKFRLKYFGTHEKGAEQYDQPIDFVKKIILKQVNSKKKLINIATIKKRIEFSKSIERKFQINLHFSEIEWKKISSKSDKQNVTPYEYCRKKLLS